MGEWKKIKLKEVLTEINDRNKGEKVTKVLSVTNSQGFVSQEEYFEGTVHSDNISNYKIVRKNQFAYNPSRVNVGSIDILKKYDEGALSPMYVIFEVNETKLLPEYFKYYFQTHEFFENVKNSTQGSVRNSLSFKSLSDFEYLLPPIEEQEKIMKILEKVDKIIFRYEELLEQKNQFIKSQFIEMFQKPNFKKERLENLCKTICAGGDIPKGRWSKEKDEKYQIPIYTNGEKEDGLYGYTDIAKITEQSVTMSARGTIGYTVIREKEFYPAIRLITLIPNSNLLNIYYLKSALKDFEVSDGTSIQQLTVPTVKKHYIPLPDIEKQRKFEYIVKIIDKQRADLKKIMINYQKLKKGLMQKLLTGKVKVKI